MAKNYIKRSFALAAAAAAVLTAGAQYTDVTGQYMKDPAFFPGWQGGLTAIADGVGETYNGAFNLYQTLNNMPAGEYTLTANAFYRCGYNDFAKEEMKDGKNHFAFIYINGMEAPVKGLFEENTDPAPNSTSEANGAFSAGLYLNTVKLTLDQAGTLVVGIKCTGGWNDDWCCFDNFKLVGPNGDVELKNANFEEGINAKAAWNCVNSGGEEKTPDFNKGGGVFRKTNASPYNFGQQVDLPAGKYRFSALTFFRYGGAGNYNDSIISCKGQWGFNVTQSPKDYFDKNLYNDDNTVDNAYLYVSFNETKPANLDWEDEFGELNAATDKRVRLKGVWEIFNGNYAEMPENETRGTASPGATEIVPEYNDTFNKVAGWCDSGCEREAAAAFISTPEKFRQYVEFELTAPAKVWVGLGKNENAPAQYWNPFVDFKLEVLTGEITGIEGVIADENAPVEYFNLQGVRVANPANGIFIVKKGNKVTKQVIR